MRPNIRRQRRALAGAVRWRRHGRRLALAGALLISVCVLFVYADAANLMPQPLASRFALRAPVAHADISPPIVPAPSTSPAPTATAVPTQGPQPTLSLVSPSSHQGPVGAHLTVSGANWTAGTVSVGAGQPGGACGAASGWAAQFGTATPSGGAFTLTFLWPTSLSSVNTSYPICASYTAATPTVVSGPAYVVLSASPPTLSFTGPSVPVGGTVTVQGTNFLGVPNVTLILGETSGQRNLTTLNLGGDGAFTYTYQPDPNDSGNVTITATSPRDGNAPAALQASATVLVQAAAATPTATLAPTVAPTVAVVPTSSVGKTPASSSDSTSLVIGLIVVGLLLLLVGGGAAIYFLVRRRSDAGESGDANAPGYGGQGAYGEYGATGRVPATVPGERDPRTSFASSGEYGRSGFSNLPGTPLPPTSGIGNVARWDEIEPGPGPDWQPRPMSGGQRGQTGQGGFLPDDSPTGIGGWAGQPAEGGAFPPPDPWANAPDPYGAPPPAGYRQPSYPPAPPSRRTGGWGSETRGVDEAAPGAHPDAGWDAPYPRRPPEPGSTNPGGQDEGW